MQGVEVKTKVEGSNAYELHAINIKEISDEFAKFIDRYFVNICEGNSESDIKIVKKRVLKFLESKSDDIRIGAIAEFFIHLYLNMLGYKQECKFLNLEEGSIKKGFDGYYSKSDEEWIMESKSGFSTSKGISHRNKIVEAYKDLEEKIKGKTQNNPWMNAYNHACHRDVNTRESIVKHMKNLADDFVLDKFYDIKDFNIIPGATIFLDGTWIDNDLDKIVSDVERYILTLRYKRIIAICCTKISVQAFIEYISKES
ncbi:MAG: hypothetical protein PHX70_11360 [Clostridium sp.]|nr:hypothetical protein [Clostridium sp.]